MTAEEPPQSPTIRPPSFLLKPNEVPQAGGSKPAVQSAATASRTEDMLKRQSSNFKAFHRAITNIELDNLTEKWEFEDLLQCVQSRWAAIDALHWDLDSQLDESNEEYERAYVSYEREYQDIKKSIDKKMW